MDQNADGTPDQNPLTNPFTGLTPGDLYVAPMPAPTSAFTFNSTNILTPPFDQNTLPLVVPGPYVIMPRCPTVRATTIWCSTTLRGLQPDVQLADEGRQLQPQRRAWDHGAGGTHHCALAIRPPRASVRSLCETSGGTTTPGVLNSTVTIPQPIASSSFPVGNVTVELKYHADQPRGLKRDPDRPGRQDPGHPLQCWRSVRFEPGDTSFSDAAILKLSQQSAPYTGIYLPDDANGLKHFIA